MEIRWEMKQRHYTHSIQGFVGKYLAFETFYDGMASKGTKKQQALKCYLNGIKPDLPNQIGEDDAKQYAEGVLEMWLENSGLMFKEEKDCIHE